MSFSTGRAQRLGGAHRVQTRHGSASFAYPAEDILRQSTGPTRATAKRRRTASIGENGATGLIIHGTHDIDTFEGTDPDSATPPISGDTLQNPDFPISYNGRGIMKFVNPIRIASIDGPLNVNGEVYSASGLLGAGGGGGTPYATWTPTVGETGAGTNFTENSGSTSAVYALSSDNVTLQLSFTWSSLNGATGNVFIKGLPKSVDSSAVFRSPVICTGITPAQMGSHFYVRDATSGTELQLFSVSADTGVSTAVTAALCAATGSISFVFNYYGVI